MRISNKMVMKIIYCSWIFICMLFCQSVAAQVNKKIRIVAIDSLENKSLDSFSVVLQYRDTLFKYQVAHSKGIFLNHHPVPDTFSILVSHRGYQEKKIIVIDKNINIDLDTIFLMPDTKMMENIVIINKVPAIVVRNDTTEFTVDSFGLRKGDMVEDILKLLPGLEIDEDGMMRFNGKAINRILVDGEDFFGGDRDMMLKKIPADLVSKIQMMDTKTQEQIFHNIQSNGEEKTLNIKLKPGLKIFGNASILAGTSNRMSGEAMGNFMNGSKHFGFLANMNTVNKLGFNKTPNYLASVSRSASTSFRERIAKKHQVNGSMSYNSNGSAQESRSQLQQFITADSSFITRTFNETNSRSGGYNGNVSYNSALDSLTHLNGGISFSNSEGRNNHSSESVTIEMGELRNESKRITGSKNATRNFEFHLSLNRRFHKKGRSIYINLNNSSGNNQADIINNSDNRYYDKNQTGKIDLLRQHIITNGENQNFGMGLTYYEPIGKKLRLQLGTSFNSSTSENQRKTYNIDSLNHGEVYDSVFSDKWISKNKRNQASASLIFETVKLNITGGFTGMINRVERTTIEDEENIYQKQVNYSPTMTALYKISKTKNLRFNFSAHNNHPSIDQIQPVADNSNPLFIRIGNPHLRSSFAQNYSLGYSSTDSIKMISGSLSYSPISNRIVNARYYDEYRKQTSQFINVDGVYSVGGSWNYSRYPVRLSSGGSFGISGNAHFGRNIFFDNSNMLYTRNYSVRQTLTYSFRGSQKKPRSLKTNFHISYSRTYSPSKMTGINSRNLNLGPGIDWEFRSGKLIEMRNSYSYSYNEIDYNAAISRKNCYLNHNFINNVSIRPNKSIMINSNFNYRYNNRNPLGTNRNIYQWNITASTELFNGLGYLGVSAVDLLNSNNDISRTVGENFIQDFQTARLGNYYTINFRYSWSKRKKNKN